MKYQTLLMKYQTFLISLAKQKQSDHQQIISNKFILAHCLPKVLLLKLSRPSYTEDLIYIDRAYTLDLFLITLKKKNFMAENFRNFSCKKEAYFLNFNEVLISELSAQKERLREKKISGNREVYRKKMNMLCIKKMILMPQYWRWNLISRELYFHVS